MRTNGEIIEAGVAFTELYDDYARGVPLHEVFRLAAERFTDFNDLEVKAVMLIAARIFDGRQGGCSQYRVQ